MQIIEFHLRIMKNNENHVISLKNNEKNENHKMLCQKNENHANPRIPFVNYENY